ncbi:MAG: hypoxanthine phosphoribosyltransferase [Deltaproteobacteria bacterium]|nr:MAG: hypoxanthine phosphoribosyltransferase [Deltaproteobacteria bacterium]
MRPLIDADTIAARVAELGAEITRDYAGKDLLVVGILSGSFVFMADLVRRIELPLRVDFMAVSSYGDGTKSSGVVRILKDLNREIHDRHVLLVEDIVDTGLTLHYLLDNLSTREPLSLGVCTLLDKREARIRDVPLNYVGFPCPDAFVVGYGLDAAGLHRNVPYIGVLEQDGASS